MTVGVTFGGEDLFRGERFEHTVMNGDRGGEVGVVERMEGEL